MKVCGGAAESAISKFDHGEVVLDVLSSNLSRSGACVVCQQFFVCQLCIGIFVMAPHNSLVLVCQHFGFKDSISPLLLPLKNLLFLHSLRSVIGVNNFLQILCPALVDKRLVPAVLIFFIFQGEE